MRPTEAEMLEAKDWAIANTSDVASFGIAIDAYAAALANRRENREKYVGHCQHCKTTIQNKDGCVVDSRGMFHPICAATLAERERCAQIADDIATKAWESYKRGHGPERADPYAEGLSDGAEKAAAAIRGGAERTSTKEDANAETDET